MGHTKQCLAVLSSTPALVHLSVHRGKPPQTRFNSDAHHVTTTPSVHQSGVKQSFRNSRGANKSVSRNKQGNNKRTRGASNSVSRNMQDSSLRASCTVTASRTKRQCMRARTHAEGTRTTAP